MTTEARTVEQMKKESALFASLFASAKEVAEKAEKAVETKKAEAEAAKEQAEAAKSAFVALVSPFGASVIREPEHRFNGLKARLKAGARLEAVADLIRDASEHSAIRAGASVADAKSAAGRVRQITLESVADASANAAGKRELAGKVTPADALRTLRKKTNLPAFWEAGESVLNALASDFAEEDGVKALARAESAAKKAREALKVAEADKVKAEAEVTEAEAEAAKVKAEAEAAKVKAEAAKPKGKKAEAEAAKAA